MKEKKNSCMSFKLVMEKYELEDVEREEEVKSSKSIFVFVSGYMAKSNFVEAIK